MIAFRLSRKQEAAKSTPRKSKNRWYLAMTNVLKSNIKQVSCSHLGCHRSEQFDVEPSAEWHQADKAHKGLWYCDEHWREHE